MLFSHLTLFDLGSATIAIRPASVDLMTLSTLHETMIKAFSTHNSIHCLWMKLASI
jgi:hypothetical protein